MLSAAGEPRSGPPAESKHPYDLSRSVGDHAFGASGYTAAE